MTASQLELGQKIIQKNLNKTDSVKVSHFAHKPISKKSIGVRIGKGKGPVSFWVSSIFFGQNLYKINTTVAFKSILKIQKSFTKKLPVKIALRVKLIPKTWLLLFILKQLAQLVEYSFYTGIVNGSNPLLFNFQFI